MLRYAGQEGISMERVNEIYCLLLQDVEWKVNSVLFYFCEVV